jgi:hypothetical protein
MSHNIITSTHLKSNGIIAILAILMIYLAIAPSVQAIGVGQFAEVLGNANPLEEVNAIVGGMSKPAAIDIDNDGDLDMFTGETKGIIRYFENIGSINSPSFVEHPDATNPFDGVDIGSHSAPVFADIDGDGDFDVLVGEYDGNINYFENTGTVNQPSFVQRTATANPFDGIDVGTISIPSFSDIDNDGDFDVFVGKKKWRGCLF